jgi:uncharacterized protein YecE (DUF72 family)
VIHVGTSGYNYPEWRGSFYPADMPADRMLAYYSERFDTVEINYSFYRLPSEDVVAQWGRGTPDNFTFTMKASRRITHDARLQDCSELTRTFCARARILGPKLGTLLFQLPPAFRKDTAVLAAFLDELSDDLKVAFEFRHASWLSPDVMDLLRRNNVALCVSDGEKVPIPVEVTARHAYFRLRDEGYEADDIAAWARTVKERTAGCDEVFVYFKHEEEGKGALFARMMREALDGKPA